MRGAGPGHHHRLRRPGTIPAGAGSSDGGVGGTQGGRDHPRGCGEQTPPHTSHCIPVGPSPRVRGAAASSLQGAECVGTIPAGAGSRSSQATTSAVTRDHPRGCGEQATSTLLDLMEEGPSPRVRGAVLEGSAKGDGVWTIPAGAGSSIAGCWWSNWAGPSPRVRGAVLALLRQRTRLGTIPAGAGSRTSTRTPRFPARDHPRGCGEQSGAVPGAASQAGPSPRVRGAAWLQPDMILIDGTIPAGAGSRLGDLRLYWRCRPFSSTCCDSGKWGMRDSACISLCRSVGVWRLCSSRMADRSGELGWRWVRSGLGGGSG